MQIDNFLPQYDFNEVHSRIVDISPEEAFRRVEAIDFSDSLLIRLLFNLRGMRAGKFKDLTQYFTLLYRKEPEEIVLGIIGRPWELRGGVKKGDFNLDRDPCNAKMVWNFSFERKGEKTLVTTETRIQVKDEKCRKKFKRYWTIVRPFSGLVRKEILRLLEKTKI